MRRNKKYNIHTNRTIKKDHTYHYCTSCKSVCKVPYSDTLDPNTISEQHLKHIKSAKKLHQIGVGSLNPGQAFVPMVTWRNHSCMRKNESIKRRRSIKRALNVDVECADFIRRVDSLVACS